MGSEGLAGSPQQALPWRAASLIPDRRADGQSIATFRFRARKSGTYDVRMAYSAHETRAKRVPVTIVSGDRKTELTVDQTLPLPAGQAFRAIGRVELKADVESTLTVTNVGTSGFVILDAVQLLEVKE